MLHMPRRIGISILYQSALLVRSIGSNCTARNITRVRSASTLRSLQVRAADHSVTLWLNNRCASAMREPQRRNVIDLLTNAIFQRTTVGMPCWRAPAIIRSTALLPRPHLGTETEADVPTIPIFMHPHSAPIGVP